MPSEGLYSPEICWLSPMHCTSQVAALPLSPNCRQLSANKRQWRRPRSGMREKPGEREETVQFMVKIKYRLDLQKKGEVLVTIQGCLYPRLNVLSNITEGPDFKLHSLIGLEANLGQGKPKARMGQGSIWVKRYEKTHKFSECNSL